MEFFIIVLLIVILIVLLQFKSKTSDEVFELNAKIRELTTSLNKLRDHIKDQRSPAPQSERPIENIKPVAIPVPREDFPEEKKEDRVKPESPRVAPEPIETEIEKPEPEVIRIPESITPPIQKEKVQVEPEPGFFERNPDLEKFIGENLANKIGIAILVLGIGFFVKYAIDKEWIGIYGRVLIGILCGGALIGIAHRLRRSFSAFSSVLVGGGIAVLYFTIYIAFHSYQILSQEVAFGIMICITAFTVLLSLAYDRIELAIVAILGGFGSPFMVSTGEGNYIVLFTYITILDVGMLVLAFYKKWRAVNIISYVFTILLFGAWISNQYDSNDVGMIRGGLIFASIFYLIFFEMNIVNNLRQRVPFEGLEFMILLSNTFLYYSAGMHLLSNPFGEAFRGLFTLLLAAFNFGFAFVLFKSNRVDKNLVFLLIGLVLTFISLAAPVQLKGNYITLFWAAETVLLLWLSQKSGITLMKIASAIVMFLMWISLIMDWANIYKEFVSIEGYSLTIVFNKGYITTLVAFLSVGAYQYMLRKDEPVYPELIGQAKWVLMIVAAAIFYVGHLLELTYHINIHVDDYAARSIIIGIYNSLFVLVIFLIRSKLKLPDLAIKAIPILGLVVIGGYFAIYHSEMISARDHYLEGTSSFLGFGLHYVYTILLLLVSVFTLRGIRMWTKFNAETGNAYSWFFVALFLFVASAELDHAVLLTASATSETMGNILRQNHKIGYPILWGIASFILITIGLKRKQRNLRIISLSLFLITLLKLFLVDIRGISEGGKIAAFISLGVLLLIVSFMYQRLKKLLLADEEEQKQNL